MPVYVPVNTNFRSETNESELLAFKLNEPGVLGTGFTACFLLSKTSETMLTVTFGADSIVRILDEMPLATEGDDGANIGLIPHVFAYTVTGTTFEASQSETWREVLGPVIHYRFPTLNMCLDVLALRPAGFLVEQIPQELMAYLN